MFHFELLFLVLIPGFAPGIDTCPYDNHITGYSSGASAISAISAYCFKSAGAGIEPAFSGRRQTFSHLNYPAHN